MTLALLGFMFFFRHGYSRLKGRAKASQDVALGVPMNPALELRYRAGPAFMPLAKARMPLLMSGGLPASYTTSIAPARHCRAADE